MCVRVSAEAMSELGWRWLLNTSDPWWVLVEILEVELCCEMTVDLVVVPIYLCSSVLRSINHFCLLKTIISIVLLLFRHEWSEMEVAATMVLRLMDIFLVFCAKVRHRSIFFRSWRLWIRQVFQVYKHILLPYLPYQQLVHDKGRVCTANIVIFHVAFLRVVIVDVQRLALGMKSFLYPPWCLLILLKLSAGQKLTLWLGDVVLFVCLFLDDGLVILVEHADVADLGAQSLAGTKFLAWFWTKRLHFWIISDRILTFLWLLGYH